MSYSFLCLSRTIAIGIPLCITKPGLSPGRLYNVEFSFVKVCIHFFGGPCILNHLLKSNNKNPTERTLYFVKFLQFSLMINFRVVLVNETKLVHDLFLVYLVNFIYKLHMFRTSPGPSSGETTVFMRHLVLVILYSWLSGTQDGFCIPESQLYRKTSLKCRINTVVPPDDGLGEVRNMYRL